MEQLIVVLSLILFISSDLNIVIFNVIEVLAKNVHGNT